VYALRLKRSAEGPPKKSCNDDIILYVFHINEDATFCDFQKMAGRPIYRALRCRYKTFFAAPSAFLRESRGITRYKENKEAKASERSNNEGGASVRPYVHK
jgi:hypothetical protein